MYLLSEGEGQGSSMTKTHPYMMQAAQSSLNPEAPEFIPPISPSFSNQNYYLPPPPNSQLLFSLQHPFSSPPLYPNSYSPSNLSLFFPPPPHLFSPVPLRSPPPVESRVVEADSDVVEKRVVFEKVGIPSESSSSTRVRVRKGRQRVENNNNRWQGEGWRSCHQVAVHWKAVIKSRVKNPKEEDHVMPIQPGSNITTVMIRNVPNRYTREMLVEFLDEHCRKENEKLNKKYWEETCEEAAPPLSAYDFLYLPIDFQSGMNRSYAFVNFTHPEAAWRFRLASHNQKWPLFHSNKIREIVCAKIQGKEALVKHLEKTRFACEWEEFLPLCFSPARDGSTELVKQSTLGTRIPGPHSHPSQSAIAMIRDQFALTPDVHC